MSRTQRRAGFTTAFITAGLLALPAMLRAALPAAAPAPGNYVNDLAGVMNPAAVAELNNTLAGLDAKAHAQVAVLTVPTLDGADLETYAMRVYGQWGIGDRKTNRGVLLLLAVRDRRARIEVGYGLEGILPDGLTGEIQDRYMVPYFKKGDYSAGLQQGALAIAAVIAHDSGVDIGAGPVAARGSRPARQMSDSQAVMVLIVMFVLAAVFSRRAVGPGYRYGGYRGGFGGYRGGGFGGFGGGSGGGFGGFGGGMSGGGGSSRSW